MKRALLLFLILIISTVFYIFLRSSNALSPRVAEPVKVFESTPPILNVRFEYPQSWKLSVSRSRNGDEETVQLLGPRDLRRQFSTSFFVIVREQKDPLDPGKTLDQILERNKQTDRFRVISSGEIVIDGENAREAIFDFNLDLPFNVVKPLTTPIREQVVVVAHAGLLYQIHFIGTREQYRESNRLFLDFLKSFHFRE